MVLRGQFQMDLPAPGILAVMAVPMEGAGASLGWRQTGKMSVQGLLSVSGFSFCFKLLVELLENPASFLAVF